MPWAYIRTKGKFDGPIFMGPVYGYAFNIYPSGLIFGRGEGAYTRNFN